MHTAPFAREVFGNIRELTFDVLNALPHEALTWRPTHEANTIAWLIWHLTRVQDDHVAGLAENTQVWGDDAGWALRFGIDPHDMRIGYGDTPDQVDQIRPADTTVLGEYLDAVTDRTFAFLDSVADEGDWDRVVDERWDPPVTARVRLASIVSDDLQHVGQAAFVRGLYERR